MRSVLISRAAAVVLGFGVLMAGCADRSQMSRNDQRPRVLTTFTVLADLARNVAGDRLQVHSIVKEGAEIHGYQFTPSDIEGAVGADLLIENGLGLELWARRFTTAAGEIPTVTLSEGMEPLLINEDAYAGKPNPHAWMSPKRAMVYVDRLREAFTKLDPDGADVYASNAEVYNKKLQALDRELRDALETIPPQHRVLVSCEGAFTYLATDYGLEEAFLWPVNAESEITPKRMARLINTVRDRAVPAVFCESTVSDKAQREVAAAANSQFGGTFYVDSLSKPDGPAPTLLDLQRHNVKLIRDGLTEKGGDG
jgi:manganese transport system substrate-binding protein